MLGDLWNQAGDPILSPGGTPTVNALRIPNLARTIGKQDLLNTLLPGTTAPLSSSMIYVDDIGTLYSGRTRAFLKYPPAVTPTVGNMILGGTFAPLIQNNFTPDPLMVLGTGTWCVTSDGHMYTYDPIPSTLTLQYQPNVISDIGDLSGPSASWNVIPDPSTWSGNYTGVKISLANNTDTSLGFHIWLPPRKPLDNTKIIRHSPTTTNNTSATPNSGSLLIFQNDSAVASTTNANHYRYNFPPELTNAGGSGDTLPGGFIYIWDETTGTIVEGATFFVPGASGDRKFKIRATGTNLIAVFGSTIGNGIITDDTTQLAADYISRFKIITVGASLSKVVSYLNKNFWNHKHKLSEGNPPVSHSDLDDLVTPPWHVSLNPIYPSGIIPFRKTQWINDDHAQYLHRAGSIMSSGTARDRHDNSVFRMLSVKSPFTTDFQGRVNLSVTDNGQVANLTATTFTTLNIGAGTGIINGDSGGQVNLDSVQVNQRLYFSDTGGSPSNTLSDDYVQFHESSNEFDFIADGSLANSMIVAGTTRGQHIIGDIDVVSVTDVTAGGDLSLGSRFGSFKYTASRYQYVNIYPTAMPLSARNISDGLEFNFGAGGIINNSTSNTSTLYVTVPFPNGANYYWK